MSSVGLRAVFAIQLFTYPKHVSVGQPKTQGQIRNGDTFYC